MLQIQAPPVVTEIQPQSAPFVGGLEDAADAYALSLVNQTFYQYEQWRSSSGGHENRWRTHDTLYFGAVPQRTWEGTLVPRASLPIQISFDQVESAVPAIMQALFVGDEWFDIQAEPGTDPAEARQVQDALRYFVEHCKNEYGHTAELEIEQAVHSTCQYGNGFLHVYYDASARKPAVEYVDIRDIYVDPATPSPNIQESRSIIHRRLMTVDELDQMRSDPRMKIPSRAQLVWMSQNRSYSVGDQTVRLAESIRKISYSPGTDDFLPLPADNYIEVLIYESKTRIIWDLNRQWIAYNQRNPYGFITYCASPCYMVLRRFYGQSIPDVLEGNQLYMQGLANAHLDELSLAINPPRWRKRGGNLLPSQLYWRPGVMTELDGDSPDMGIWQSQNVTANVREDLAYLESLSERRTGINSMGQGAPKPSNANRTMGGMQLQLSGAASRLYRTVLHAERYLIVPMLYMMYRLVQYHGNPGEFVPGVSTDNELTQVPAQAFQAPVKFRVYGSSKMLSRERLQQQLPVITQYLAAGPVLEQLQRVGKTFDWEVFTQMIQDATGTAQKYQLIRQMTPEEQQAAQQPDPKTAADLQKAQLEAQTRQTIMDKKTQSEQSIAQLQMAADAAESDEQSSREILKMVLEELLSGNEEAAAKVKLQLQQALGAQKLQQSEQQHRQKMSQMQESASNKVMTDLMKFRGESQIKGAQTAQDMMLSGAQGAEKVRQTRELGDAKIEQARALAKAKPSPKRTESGSMRSKK